MILTVSEKYIILAIHQFTGVCILASSFYSGMSTDWFRVLIKLLYLEFWGYQTVRDVPVRILPHLGPLGLPLDCSNLIVGFII